MIFQESDSCIEYSSGAAAPISRRAFIRRAAILSASGIVLLSPHAWAARAPDDRDRTHGRRRRAGRSRRPFRVASRARAAGEPMARRHAGVRARMRLAGSDAIAFRRAGFHGERHPGHQIDAGWMAESGAGCYSGYAWTDRGVESRSDGGADSKRQGAGREYRAGAGGGAANADGPAGNRSGVRSAVRRQRFDQPRLSRWTRGTQAPDERTGG